MCAGRRSGHRLSRCARSRSPRGRAPCPFGVPGAAATRVRSSSAGDRRPYPRAGRGRRREARCGLGCEYTGREAASGVPRRCRRQAPARRAPTVHPTSRARCSNCARPRLLPPPRGAQRRGSRCVRREGRVLAEAVARTRLARGGEVYTQRHAPTPPLWPCGRHPRTPAPAPPYAHSEYRSHVTACLPLSVLICCTGAAGACRPARAHHGQPTRGAPAGDPAQLGRLFGATGRGVNRSPCSHAFRCGLPCVAERRHRLPRSGALTRLGAGGARRPHGAPPNPARSPAIASPAQPAAARRACASACNIATATIPEYPIASLQASLCSSTRERPERGPR